MRSGRECTHPFLRWLFLDAHKMLGGSITILNEAAEHFDWNQALVHIKKTKMQRTGRRLIELVSALCHHLALNMASESWTVITRKIIDERLCNH